MRSSITGAARIGCAIGDVAVPRPLFVCRDCLGQASPATAPGLLHTRGYASKKSLTERLRGKIWKGDAPGPQNVYGQPRLFPGKQSRDEVVEEKLEDIDELDTEVGNGLVTREALTVEEAKRQDASYEPATDWTGLEKIGGPKGWWEREWDKENQFVAFSASKQSHFSNANVLFNEVRQAYVESYVVRNNNVGNYDTSDIPKSLYPPFEDIKVTAEAGSSATLAVPSSYTEQIIRLASSGKQEAADEARNTHDTEAIQRTESLLDPGAKMLWHSLPLTDPALKFATIKRVTQLTGARIPDPVIGKLQTFGHLVEHLEYKPPPKKTAALLNERLQLTELPNVHIYNERQSWVDREKRSGRYKVIVSELKKRGLPLPKKSRKNRS